MNYLKSNLQFLNTTNQNIITYYKSNRKRIFQLNTATNGQANLIINSICFYSKYNPMKDAEQFIRAQIDSNTKHYILCGIGLGYHAELLLNLEQKKITIYEPDISLLQYLFTQISYCNLLSNPNVNLVTQLKDLNITSNHKLILPIGWLNSLEDGDIKNKLQEFQVNVMSIRNNKNQLSENYIKNLKYNTHHLNPLILNFTNKKAILVSAGPSLDETARLLKKFKNKYFILCVGAAFKTLKHHDIVPDAVIITDSSPVVFRQVEDIQVSVPLFFLSTIYPKVLEYIHTLKIKIFQEGFPLAEEYALENRIPLVQTGGSVATTAFDLLIKLGFNEIIFLGQDLAYGEGKSHANTSTSNKEFSEIVVNRTTLSNNGKIIPTSTSWMIFKKFFEKKIHENPTIKVYNTSENGAKIEGTTLVNLGDIKVEKLKEINFVKLIEQMYT